MVVVPSPVKIDLEKDNDLIDFIFLGSLYSLRIWFWTTTIPILKNWKSCNILMTFANSLPTCIAMHQTLKRWMCAACGPDSRDLIRLWPRERGGARGSRGEWMTMDQSNKRADLSIPSGLNPAAAEFGSNSMLLTVEQRDTCVTVSEQCI